MLETLCRNDELVIIGIGSCNKYNARNPFTADESEEMIKAALKEYDNFVIKKIPDFAQDPKYKDGQKWREYVKTQYGDLDYFISGNPYVTTLLGDDYDIIHPAALIPPENQVRLRATEVRIEMARGGDWEKLVPEPVAEYIKQNGLDERFRREFGLGILAGLTNDAYQIPESAEQEKVHTQEG